MKTNPLRTHTIAASGTDGTVKGFIAARKTLFKYASRGLDMTEVYSALADAALGDSKDALKKIKAWTDQAAWNFKRMTETIDEAEKCMDTLGNVFDKVDAAIEEQLADKKDSAK